MKHLKNSLNTRTTSQTQRAREDQVENYAGGYVFSVSDMQVVERFLVLGTEGGTYYASEKDLTLDMATKCQSIVKSDGEAVVAKIVEVSDSGQAIKNDPALFLLAMCAGIGDEDTRKAALAALPKVARMSTHLFHFVEFIKNFRGWGRGLKNAVAKWYDGKGAGGVAYQAVKYRQRDGWTHRDVLRLAHPVAKDPVLANVYKYIVSGEVTGEVPGIITDYERLKGETNPSTIVRAIQGNKLITWEMLNTEALKSQMVWEALLPNMPLTAMIRNLGRMSAIGVIHPFTQASQVVVGKLTDREYLRKSRVHPIVIYNAWKTYKSGHGMRGSLSWTADQQVVDALENAFYMSFDFVEASGKRYYLGLDVSASMTWGEIGGANLNPREASGLLALVSAKVEPFTYSAGFTGSWGYPQSSDGMQTLQISSNDSMESVQRKISNLDFGGTDCALPMIDAMNKGLLVDTFVVYTDNETWAGDIQPFQALQAYRDKTGIDAKLVVVGMTATGFSIADPNDPGMLDVVGFNTSTPQAISKFAAM